MSKLSLIICFVVILAIGLVRIVLRPREIKAKREFTRHFLTRLVQYIQSAGRDCESYTWLVHRSPKLQAQLGSLGFMSVYRPPYADYVYRNYPIILNLLPELHKSFEYQTIGNPNLPFQYGEIIQETLIRHIGILDDQLEQIARSLKNPVIWLREGFQFILAIPILFLNWVGIISTTALIKISESSLFKVLSGLITLIGLLGSIITITVGWEPFIAIVRQTLHLK